MSWFDLPDDEATPFVAIDVHLSKAKPSDTLGGGRDEGQSTRNEIHSANEQRHHVWCIELGHIPRGAYRLNGVRAKSVLLLTGFTRRVSASSLARGRHGLSRLYSRPLAHRRATDRRPAV